MSSAKVQLHYLDDRFYLLERKRLKLFIESLFRKEKKGLSSLNYIFCSDDYLLKINREYLKHDFYTDIVSFDFSTGGLTEGEIYISVDRVRENASKFGVSFKYELHRVIFHGALHLCGYKDKTKRDILMMRKKEDQALLSYFK